jgi:hypothetical protein
MKNLLLPTTLVFREPGAATFFKLGSGMLLLLLRGHEHRRVSLDWPVK